MRPPSRENSEFCSSGKLNAKGIFPWNHGFTVWRSVEITSTGEELANVSTCRSAISLKTGFWADWLLKWFEVNPPAARITATAAVNAHAQRKLRCGFEETFCWI